MARPTPCQRIETWLSALVDGEIGGRWRRAVKRHLAECPHCRALEAHLLALKGRLSSQMSAWVGPPSSLWGRIQQGLVQVESPPAAPLNWLRWGLAPALGLAVVLFVVGTLVLLRGEAALGPEALAAEFPRQGGVVLPVADEINVQGAISRTSDSVGFQVSPPDLSACGFRLVRVDATEIGGAKAASFVYRRGCDVVVVSQLGDIPRLKGFLPSVGKGGQRVHEAVVKDLKVVVWEEGGRLCSLSSSRQVFAGPMGGMRCGE